MSRVCGRDVATALGAYWHNVPKAEDALAIQRAPRRMIHKVAARLARQWWPDGAPRISRRYIAEVALARALAEPFPGLEGVDDEEPLVETEWLFRGQWYTLADLLDQVEEEHRGALMRAAERMKFDELRGWRGVWMSEEAWARYHASYAHRPQEATS